MIRLTHILNEEKNPLYTIAYSTNKDEIRKAISYFKKSMWNDSDIKKAVEKFKKEYPQKKSPSTHYDNRNDVVNWNPKTYKKWIKDVSSNGGKNHSYDMAQNANNERGLIDYIKKQIRRDGGDESPLERIQWDIEAS